MNYIHDLDDWPDFQWDKGRLMQSLSRVRHNQGRLIGRMESLGFQMQSEAVLTTLVQDVTKSSEIEGELLDVNLVRSSVARKLGMDIGALAQADRNVEGVVEMMLDATQQHTEPLNENRLYAWHAALFPTAHSGMKKIIVGAWRDDRTGPMQVVSGPIDREQIHFEAPGARRIPGEMTRFLKWFNNVGQLDSVLKAALAHLWFITIHPFDDGNGRIARVISDMELARSENSSQRFYSLSSQIQAERNDYYRILETTQKGDLDITPWLEWFLGCLNRAIEGAETTLSSVLYKAGYWKILNSFSLNQRQKKVLSRMLDGFEGKLTSSKWATITKTSPDTALRDINDLVEKGILARGDAGGRSTSYLLSPVENHSDEEEKFQISNLKHQTNLR